MRYRLVINSEPKRKMRLLPKRFRKEIGYRIFLLQEDLAGNVKKLKAEQSLYRLRIGDYRVIFALEGDLITIYDVGHRREVYR